MEVTPFQETGSVFKYPLSAKQLLLGTHSMRFRVAFLVHKEMQPTTAEVSNQQRGNPG
jgi:hypothetical protein